MNSSQTIASLALRLLIISQFQKTTENEQEFQQRNHSSIDLENNHSPPVTNQRNQLFHLSRSKDITPISYGSAIALKLEKLQKRPSAEIASQMATNLVTLIENSCNISQHPSLDRVWQTLEIRSTPQGWLKFVVSEAGLAAWMQLLIDFPSNKGTTLSEHSFLSDESNSKYYNQFFRKSTSLFAIQHTHARCCSLLRLCDREGLIQLTSDASSPSIWHIKMPSPLPWLTDAGALRLTHLAEQRLIAQLVTVLDELAELDAPNSSLSTSDEAILQQLLKLAETLSQAFLSFHAACRLLGAVKAIDLPLAQARVGLVLATQTVLKFLLEAGLGVVAPTEL